MVARNKETFGVTLLTLAVVMAYSVWGAHILKVEATPGNVSQAVSTKQ